MSQQCALEIVIPPSLRRRLDLVHYVVGNVLLEGGDEVAELRRVRRDVADDELLLCIMEPETCIIYIEKGQLKANSHGGVFVLRHDRIESSKVC